MLVMYADGPPPPSHLETAGIQYAGDGLQLKWIELRVLEHIQTLLDVHGGGDRVAGCGLHHWEDVVQVELVHSIVHAAHRNTPQYKTNGRPKAACRTATHMASEPLSNHLSGALTWLAWPCL